MHTEASLTNHRRTRGYVSPAAFSIGERPHLVDSNASLLFQYSQVFSLLFLFCRVILRDGCFPWCVRYEDEDGEDLNEEEMTRFTQTYKLLADK